MVGRSVTLLKFSPKSYLNRITQPLPTRSQWYKMFCFLSLMSSKRLVSCFFLLPRLRSAKQCFTESILQTHQQTDVETHRQVESCVTDSEKGQKYNYLFFQPLLLSAQFSHPKLFYFGVVTSAIILSVKTS